MADKDQRTEQPTQRRLKKAREEGRFPTARVFVSALQFLAFVAMLRAFGLPYIQNIRNVMAELLRHATSPHMAAFDIIGLSVYLLRRVLTPLLTLGAVMVGVTLAIQLGVTRMGVSLKRVTPDFKRLNPASRLKDLPRQNLTSLLQATVMIPVFAIVLYLLVKDNFDNYFLLPLRTISSSALLVAGSIQTLLWKASILFMVFGTVDLIRQKQRYQQDLKMSKQDIRDEMKEIEGNPLVKHRLRRLRRDMARRRMMHEVPKAAAVIVNPTHYAVALSYTMSSLGAPKVVAKGKNYLALRIRQKAVAHQVPLIENPPLAQALYKAVDVGQEIPVEFYRAVAEVLAYIFKMMNGRRPA
ncbi:MAG TPA: EscU/YscU/HrcU family type III secretion system export apparatus switch protein [Bryobacteraceae bacterium]|nr:EscU/YscU/HrcU family type III secretion system export apparatus switch protein [Bryobacteraceae bacterium]